jgi:hypothetical protein
MRRVFTLLLSGLLLPAFLYAQRLEPSGIQLSLANKNQAPTVAAPQRSIGNQQCGFDYVLNRARAKGFSDAVFENQLKSIIEQRMRNGSLQRTAAIVTLPIIFHVVHRGEAVGTTPNVSRALVDSQIAQLNRDFANLSFSVYGVAADMEIRFCAALVDPQGRVLSQPGIHRINGVDSSWSNTATMSQTALINYFDATIKPRSIWDPYAYVNVWTADMTNSSLLGYATFPGLSTLAGLDEDETDGTAGVVIAAGSVGSKYFKGPLSPYDEGRTLTHELGHFFGLRHIWGDGGCTATDYCADTPPQSGETSGCPAVGTLNGCTPSVAKMFENYMDYSNDACLNTFTADQKLRMQAVMTNSPRRKELLTSAACQARPGNAVQFDLSAAIRSEAGPAGVCPSTQTVQVKVAASVAATGNATLTFGLGGTATNNGDYTVSPASVSFTNGDNSVKTVTITIVDDKAVEAAETLVLNYVISGTGVVAGPEKQTFTLTIQNDDFNATINNNATVNLLSENFDASTSLPLGWAVSNGTNAWVISANGGDGTTANAAHITQNTTTKPNTYSKTATSQSFLVTPALNAAGLVDVNVSFKWRCKGERFGGTDYDAGYLGYILPSDPSNVFLFTTVFNNQAGANPAAASFSATLPSSFNNSQFRLVFFWENDNSDGTDPGFTIDDVVITGKAISIETTGATTVTQSQFSGQTAQYISTDNQIVATIGNLSQNIGCITTTVQSAGTGRTAITTATGSYFRTNKVIRISPATANTTATYQVTLYFAQAELSPAWTSGEISSLKILKVKDGVNLAGTISAVDAELITPTFNNQSATNGYYAYTATCTGFSQFMLVSPSLTLPVSLVQFEAKALKKSIELNWKTSMEANNKGFVLERSADGNNFTQIGWTDGKGDATTETKYQFNDHFVQPNTTYYYRLRQQDKDGRESLSSVRQARINSQAISLQLSPNPAKGWVQLFLSGSERPANVTVIAADGRIVYTARQVNMTLAPYSINTAGWAKGYYSVRVEAGGEIITSKLVVQ